MHIKRFPAFGKLHLRFGAFPIKELGVVCEALPLQVLQAGLVVRMEQRHAFLHHFIGSPALGIDDIGILESLLHGAYVLERTARFLCLPLGQFHHVRN